MDLSDIQAVSFDVGGTLLEPWPSVGEVYAEVAARFVQQPLDPAALNDGFMAAWKNRHPFDYSRNSWRQLVDQTFARLLPTPLPSSAFDAIYEHFGTPGTWRVFEDVLPALESLRALGLRLAVISNWDERLEPLLAGLSLTSWFETIISSHTIGQTKPAPEIFRATAARLRLEPGQILHVGDSMTEDVAGAQGVRMPALLLARRRQASEPAPDAAVLARLDGLLAALIRGGWRGRPD